MMYPVADKGFGSFHGFGRSAVGFVGLSDGVSAPRTPPKGRRIRVLVAAIAPAAAGAGAATASRRRRPTPGARTSQASSDQRSSFKHVPVLLNEVVEAFTLSGCLQEEGSLFVDCTLGGGGHTEALLERFPCAGVLGIDKDTMALESARRRLVPQFGADRVHLVHGSFADVEAHVAALPQDGQRTVRALLADLGVSSPQVDMASRGFSFRLQGPLDMRMNPDDPVARPAWWYLQNLEAEELAHYLRDYGEEPHAEAVAAALTAATPTTTRDAADVIRSCIPDESTMKIHPATKTFQALRILVNGELDDLIQMLNAAPRILSIGGLLCCISFHSLEERLVKSCIRGEPLLYQKPTSPAAPVRSDTPFEPIGPRAMRKPTDREMERNPRSRCAKLRAAVRLGEGGGHRPGKGSGRGRGPGLGGRGG